MFWALAQWQKDREASRRERRRLSSRARAAGLAAGIAEGIAAGIAEGIAEGQRGIVLNMWNSAQSEEERARIRSIADEHGIALPPEKE